MSDIHNPEPDLDRPLRYHIRIQGHLDPRWAGWFGDVTIALEDDGATIITCSVADQAALYGFLRKVRDLGMPLLSVTRAEPRQEDESNVNQ